MTTHHTGHLPGAAEVVRTLSTGRGRAQLRHPLAEDGIPVLHGATSSGQLVLAVPKQHRAVPLSIDQPLALRIRDFAPLLEASVERAVLEILGWATLPTNQGQATAALAKAWPPLPELWANYRLVAVGIAEAQVHWVGGCHTVSAAAIAEARPDPLCAVEAELLDQLRGPLQPLLLDAVQQLGLVSGPDGRCSSLSSTESVLAIALDCYGLIAHCFTPRRQVLRLPFPAPIHDPQRASAQVMAALHGYAQREQVARQ
jgi:hypothetical protein